MNVQIKLKMNDTYFKHECGLIIDRKAHNRIKKKVVFDRFEVTPCPKCKQFGGWNIMKKIGNDYEEIKFAKNKQNTKLL